MRLNARKCQEHQAEGALFPVRTLQLENLHSTETTAFTLVTDYCVWELCCTETQGLFPAYLVVWTLSIWRQLSEGSLEEEVITLGP